MFMSVVRNVIIEGKGNRGGRPPASEKFGDGVSAIVARDVSVGFNPFKREAEEAASFS